LVAKELKKLRNTHGWKMLIGKAYLKRKYQHPSYQKLNPPLTYHILIK
jgi:hypothetical protein